MKLILEIVTAIILAEILEYPIRQILRKILGFFLNIVRKWLWKLIQFNLRRQAKKYKKKE